MVYYSSIIYINNILKYFYFYIKCVSLFSFASFLFFFAYTDWIQYVYRMDTDWIQIGYTMYTLWIQNVYICQKSVFTRLIAVLEALFFVVLATIWQQYGNQTATKRQPKKNPSFSAGAKFLKL